MQEMNAFGLRLLADMRRAVGGDQNCRQGATGTPAQFRYRADAVATIEMIVDKQAVRLEPARIHRRERFDKIGCRQHTATPTAEQLFHAVKNAAIVVDAKRNREI